MEFLKSKSLWIVIASVVVVITGIFSYGVFFSSPEAQLGEKTTAESLPPVNVEISLSPSTELTPDQIVTFDASNSIFNFTDDKIREVRYLWDFGDGNDSNGAKADHQYLSPGEYQVKLQIEVIDVDSKFYAEEESITVKVARPPLPIPVADFLLSPEDRIVSQDEVIFDASQSGFESPASSSLQTQWEYQWEFFDEHGIKKGEKTGQKVNYSFNPPQHYKAKLTIKVTDQFGRSESAVIEKIIPVDNLPPVPAVFVEPVDSEIILANQPVIFNASESVDPEAGSLIFEWDFNGDSIADHVGPELRVRWDDGFNEGQNSVIVRIRDEYMESRSNIPPVTYEIKFDAAPNSGANSKPEPSLPGPPTPFVASGGIGVIGDLQLWNVAAGMDFGQMLDLGFSMVGMIGYGANLDQVTTDYTEEYPVIGRSFRDARVTTTIESASLFSLGILYNVFEGVYLGGNVGYLSLRGEHRSNHPRVLIKNRTSLSFRENSVVISMSLGYRFVFGLISIQVNYVI